MTWSAPRPLAAADHVAEFDCGSDELSAWLRRYAWQSQCSGIATTFVVCHGTRVIAYYALATGGVAHADAPPRVARGVPRHAIPVILLARLAVDADHQGHGLGRALVRHAMAKVASVADEVAVRALLIHAKDEDARAFYLSIAEFEQSPTDPLHLLLLMKDLRAALTPSSVPK